MTPEDMEILREPADEGKRIYPRIYQISILFSLAAILLIVIGFRAQYKELLSGLVITQAIMLFLPVIMILALRMDIKKTLRLNSLRFSDIVLITIMMPFAMIIVGILNVPYIILLKLIFGKVAISQPPIPEEIGSFAVMLLIVGLVAGICEEVFFRGAIMRGFERLGTVPAIAISSILFGLMHYDFQKFPSTALLGVLIAIIVYRTNSLYAGMIAHTANNASAMVFGFILEKIQKFYNIPVENTEVVQDIDISQLFSTPVENFLPGLIMFLIIATVFLILPFAATFTVFVHNTKNVSREAAAVKERLMPGILWMIPGLALIGLMYFALALNLLGIQSASVIGEIIKKFLLR